VLPQDIAFIILRNVENLETISLVCKKWKKILENMLQSKEMKDAILKQKKKQRNQFYVQINRFRF
jgi:hypothetical protein